MEESAFTDLEAELGPFEPLLPDPPPRQDHGNSNSFFDVPAETVSRLDPPSKTKSLYPFGDNGTLAWTNPAGELLYMASSVNNRLVGVEYLKSISEGSDYDDRADMTQQAIETSHGSGYGFGLSLGIKMDPSEVLWLHNRWPRYLFEYKGLKIRMQYYIESQAVIQHCQIRNDGQEIAKLPYVVSSDVFFLEHRGLSRPHQSSRFDISPGRSLLLQNSKLIMRSPLHRAQMEMVLFLNGERQHLWAYDQSGDNEHSAADSQHKGTNNEEMLEVERSIRKAINDKKYLSEDKDYEYRDLYIMNYGGDNKPVPKLNPLPMINTAEFSTCQQELTIPAGSTQELALFIHISPHSESERSLHPPPVDEIQSEKGSSSEEAEPTIFDLWSKEERLAASASGLSLDWSEPKNKQKIIKLIEEHVELGHAFAKIGATPEARYHFHIAYLVAEPLQAVERRRWDHTRLAYCAFLDDNGWHRTAFDVAQYIVHDLLDETSNHGDMPGLETTVVDSLAKILSKNGRVAEAQALYVKGLKRYSQHGSKLNVDSIHFLERIALIQAYRGLDRDALASYLRILDWRSPGRKIVFSNLGFISRRLGRFAEAKAYYERSLEESGSEMKNDSVQSGLSICLRELGDYPNNFNNVETLTINYIDINFLLSQLPARFSPFDKEEFAFALERHLESLVSMYSISVKNHDEPRGIAFVDGDPLECVYAGRNAYMQFRFLIQCEIYLRSVHTQEDAKRHLQDRIKAVCEGHLVWLFQSAECTQTWGYFYTIDGTKQASLESTTAPLTKSIEGARQFLKLSFYFSAWDTEWLFVSKLLHGSLKQWLLYLESSRHMANLWIENDDMQAFKPSSSTSDNVGEINLRYPRYRLSEATLVWLALLHTERMIQLIEERSLQMAHLPDNSQSKIKDIRQDFDLFKDTFGIQSLRSKILSIFKVPKRELTALYVADDKQSVRYAIPTKHESETQVQADVVVKRQKEVIAFQRSIKESLLNIEPRDFDALEASLLGFFEGSRDGVKAAWRESLSLQKDLDISDCDEATQLALIMFAAKSKCNLASSRTGRIEDASKSRLRYALYDSGFFAHVIVDDVPQSMSQWTTSTYPTACLLLASLSKACREIFLFNESKQSDPTLTNALTLLMEGSRPPNRIPISMHSGANLSLRLNHNKFVDTDFLPDWMYHYPNFMHQEELDIDVAERLKDLVSVESLAPAVSNWRASKQFNIPERWRFPFHPSLMDSGTKKRLSNSRSSTQREIEIRDYFDRTDFWKRLLRARTPKESKKRLIELPSQDRESVMICWLTIPEEESDPFLEFFRRHESSESFFGERAHWMANFWETEFHLGFHELVEVENGSAGALLRHEIHPVALSFRFVGDLRDQFWTCHFFSSVKDGFHGFIEEYYGSGDSKYKVHADRQGQRKVLELSYVEKALSAAKRSVNKILSAFEKDLNAPETRDAATQSSAISQDYSSVYLEIGRKISNVLQQLDATFNAIEQWEKREETRGFRSRWSKKDESTYGEKLRDLTTQCKVSVQQLRVQHGRLREQQRAADQGHNSLMSYKQLQEARASTQLAADVRVFTYVTIIFLPLTFSSSLFSMAGAPQGSTIFVMIPTTVIALTVTVIVLANMKILHRHWNSLLNKIRAQTRNRMKADEQTQKWKNISRQLEETTQRRLVNTDFERGLPASSTWWYSWFWLSYSFQSIRRRALKSLHTKKRHGQWSVKRLPIMLGAFLLNVMCIILCVIYCMIMAGVDTLHLLWRTTCRMSKKALGPEATQQVSKNIGPESESQRDDKDNKEASPPVIPTDRDKSIKASPIRAALSPLITWIESSPRPIRDYINKMDRQTLEEDSKSLSDKAQERDRNEEDMITKLLSMTKSYTKHLTWSRSASDTKQDESKDPVIANLEKSESRSSGEQSAATSQQLPTSPPPTRHKRRSLLRQSTSPAAADSEERMWVGWSSV